MGPLDIDIKDDAMRSLLRLVVSSFASIAIIALSVAPSLAAPQILALLATPEPVPLSCEAGVCRAELAAFCMQQQRPGPTNGTRYRIHDAAAMSIVGQTTDGRQVAIPLGAEAEIITVRGYKSVRVSVAEASLAGLRDAALLVSPRASLVPEPKAGDGFPLTEDEIAHVTGPLRYLAASVMERRADRRDAAVIVSHLVNALPVLDRLSPAEKEGLWDRVIGDGRGHWSPAGLSRGRQALDICRERGGFVNWRACLTFRQDMLMQDLNMDYWNAVKPGS